MVRLLLLAALALAAPTRPVARITAAELLDQMQAVPGLTARYSEEKRFALLLKPLISQGTVHFAPPAQLARHQTSPSRSSVLIDRTTLRFGDEFGTDKIDLGSRPVVRAFVDSFLKVLQGDREGLAKLYDVTLTPEPADPRAWTLVLRPKLKAVHKVIDRIVVTGREAILHRLEVHEVGGDSTITTFAEVDAQHRYSGAERERVFRILLGGP